MTDTDDPDADEPDEEELVALLVDARDRIDAALERLDADVEAARNADAGASGAGGPGGGALGIGGGRAPARGPQPDPCPLCGEEFETLDEKDRHLAEDHERKIL